MSLFLGKIHYWLFNKILWFENLEDEIIDFFNKENIKIDYNKIVSKYGKKLENKNLEEIIDTENIHGWLQDRINSSEGRMASLTSEILKKDEKNIEKLKEIYKNQAIKAVNELDTEKINNAKEIYQAMNDYVLDGMPCDRVNDVFTIEEDLVQWRKSKCVHKDIWEEEGLDVDIFYDLRDEWIKTFVSKIDDNYEYTKNEDVFSIKLVRR